jgi:hypothetical protein
MSSHFYEQGLIMKKMMSRQVLYAAGALLVGSLAIATLFTPARAMVERTATGGAAQRAVASPQDTASSASTGIIGVQLGTADGPPPPAARFYGSLKLGSSASGSTTVAAVGRNGAACGSATLARASASAATYALDITGTDAACTEAGSSVRFLINGKAATAKAAIPSVSAAVHADLVAP